ncbi:MAG: CinA family protein [Clostridia bacterium]|nr:CinA family protein [Clostridia bacterium]MBR5428431.1 CinA family protein [Clostridia bacterium]
MDENIARGIVSRLKENGLRVCFAESCTGGLCSAAITSIGGSSEVFDFGAVTYSNEMKEKLLGVEHDTLVRYGAVSRQTAEQMARGIAAFSGAQIGVGVTGIAGPGSDGTDKPVGLIYIGIRTADGYERVVELRNSFTCDVRERNRASAVDAAFSLIGEYLNHRESEK